MRKILVAITLTLLASCGVYAQAEQPDAVTIGTPAPSAWSAEADVGACFIPMAVEKDGQQIRVLQPAPQFGLVLWRNLGDTNVGVLGAGGSIDLLTIPDTSVGATYPRLAPAIEFHLGSQKWQGFAGAAYDFQSVTKPVVFTFGLVVGGSTKSD